MRYLPVIALLILLAASCRNSGSRRAVPVPDIHQSDVDEDAAGPVHTGVAEAKKLNLSVDPAEDGITIAELYSNKEKYAGKVVRIRGAVTRYNPSIMETNWIHIQDGTEHAGKFDLAVTSGQATEPGEVIIVEGRIALDRDFGYGYFYEVLMENAEIRMD